MPLFKRILSTLLVATMLASPAAMAHAQLSASQVSAINGKSGIRMFTADGDYVGTTTGINIGQDQTRIFFRTLQGSILRQYRTVADSTITTSTDQLTLRGSDLYLASSTQRVKTKLNYSASDDPPMIMIVLTGLK